MATSMAYTLIGEFYPLEKRGRAIGWMVASTALTYIVGTPIIRLIAGVSSWRVGDDLVFVAGTHWQAWSWPSWPFQTSQMKICPSVKEPFFAGCKQAITNRSAVAALFVTMFTMAEGSIGFYAVSFFRFHFSITIGLGSLVIMVGSILSAAGGVVAGLFVNRVGRKPLGTFTCLLAAVFTLAFTFMPTFELSWGLNAIRFWFAGMSMTAGGSLVIEQLPRFRGTMMSLNTTFMNLGMLLASVAGGVALDVYGYQALALILGGLGVAGHGHLGYSGYRTHVRGKNKILHLRTRILKTKIDASKEAGLIDLFLVHQIFVHCFCCTFARAHRADYCGCSRGDVSACVDPV